MHDVFKSFGPILVNSPKRINRERCLVHATNDGAPAHQILMAVMQVLTYQGPQSWWIRTVWSKHSLQLKTNTHTHTQTHIRKCKDPRDCSPRSDSQLVLQTSLQATSPLWWRLGRWGRDPGSWSRPEARGWWSWQEMNTTWAGLILKGDTRENIETKLKPSNEWVQTIDAIRSTLAFMRCLECFCCGLSSSCNNIGEPQLCWG